MIILANLEELHPQQRAAGKIKRSFQFIAQGHTDMLPLGSIIQPCQVFQQQRYRHIWQNDLHRLTLNFDETGPQSFMPLDHRSHCAFQHLRIKFAPQAEGHGQVVFRAGFLQLINKPKALLRK